MILTSEHGWKDGEKYSLDLEICARVSTWKWVGDRGLQISLLAVALIGISLEVFIALLVLLTRPGNNYLRIRSL